MRVQYHRAKRSGGQSCTRLIKVVILPMRGDDFGMRSFSKHSVFSSEFDAGEFFLDRRI